MTAASRRLKAALAYVGLVFGAGFVLGSVRVPLLVPRLGVRLAELAEMPVMFIVIVFAARYVVRHFALPPAAGERLSVGVGALACLVGAEFALAFAWQGLSPLAYVASRDPVSGSVYAALLVLFALIPWLMAARERATRR